MPSCLQTFLSVVVDMPSTSAASFCSGERSQQRRARAGSSEPQPRRATRPQRKHGQAARVGAGWQTCWTQNRGSTVLRWIFRSLPPCARQRRRAVRVREARGKVEPFGRGAHAGDTEARGPRRRAARTHTDAACACPLGHPTDLRRGQTVTEPAADCTSVQRRTAGSSRPARAQRRRRERRGAPRRARALMRPTLPVRKGRVHGAPRARMTNAPTRACAVVDGQARGTDPIATGCIATFFLRWGAVLFQFWQKMQGGKNSPCAFFGPQVVFSNRQETGFCNFFSGLAVAIPPASAEDTKTHLSGFIKPQKKTLDT